MKNKINNINFSTIIFFISQQSFLGIGLLKILTLTRQNSIYVSFISSIFTLFILLFFLSYFNYLPNYNIKDKIKITYKKTNKIINLFILLFTILFFIYSLLLLSIYIQNKYLNETPKILIILLFLIPIVYNVNCGIKTISKTSFILFIISILDYIFMFIGITKYINFENFKPLFEVKYNNLLLSSINYSIYLCSSLFLICSVSKNDLEKPKSINKHIIIFIMLCNFFIFLLLFGIIGVFGIDLSLIFDFPGYILTKKINFFDFINHIENIISLVWLIGIFFNCVMSLYLIKIYIKSNRLYYLTILTCLLVSSLFFNNSNLLLVFIRKYYALPFIVLFLIMLKRNKN